MKKRQRAREIRRVDLSDVELASSGTARRINRDIVLELIRTRQPISRAELARQSGLQRSTVSQIIEQLLAEKWVCEGCTAVSQRGRRPILIGLNERLVALTVDVHSRQATVAMVDLNGKLMSRSMVPLSRDPGASAEAILKVLSHMKAEFKGMSVEGIGVSLPGRVAPHTDRLIFAPNLHWRDFDLKNVIEKRMKLPVHLANAAIACLLAQMTFHHVEGNADAVLITASEGLGAAIFANGSIITGHDGMAGELGHIAIDPQGPECACAPARGCGAGIPAARLIRPRAAVPCRWGLRLRRYTRCASRRMRGGKQRVAALRPRAQEVPAARNGASCVPLIAL